MPIKSLSIGNKQQQQQSVFKGTAALTSSVRSRSQRADAVLLVSVVAAVVPAVAEPVRVKTDAIVTLVIFVTVCKCKSCHVNLLFPAVAEWHLSHSASLN